MGRPTWLRGACDQALKLWCIGLYREAAVTLEDAARDIGEGGEGVREGLVLAAMVWVFAGVHENAVRCLLEGGEIGMRGASVELEYIRRRSALEAMLALKPRANELEARMRELEAFSKAHQNAYRAGVRYLRAELMAACGDWSACLEERRGIWTSRGQGAVCSPRQAFGLLESALRTGKEEEIARWREKLDGCERWTPGKCCEPWVLCGRVLVGLYRGEAVEAMRHASELAESVAVASWPRMVELARELRTRASLLDRGLGDPEGRTHPARVALGGLRRGRRGTALRFGKWVLLVDYQLACVRYVARMYPVDDLYYRVRQGEVRKVGGISAMHLGKRVARARLVVARARAVAVGVDRGLGCRWREEEVGRREERLEEIVERTRDGVRARRG